MNPQCKDCRFWKVILVGPDKAHTRPSVYEGGPARKVGTCHFNPPTVTLQTFPNTLEDDWCGEFQVVQKQSDYDAMIAMKAVESDPVPQGGGKWYHKDALDRIEETIKSFNK